MFLCFYVSMFLCFYVSMFLCFCVSVFLCFYVSMFLCFYVSMFLCFYVSVFLCFNVSMFLCFYVSVFLCFNVSVFPWLPQVFMHTCPHRLRVLRWHLLRTIDSLLRWPRHSFAARSAPWKRRPFKPKLGRRCPSAASTVWQICTCTRGCCGSCAASRRTGPQRRSLISCGCRCSLKDIAA